MNFSLYIAHRYFFSKKSSNAVNIISAISMFGILIGTSALIIVLSAFNGLESLVKGFYNSFDPELKVLPTTGKYFQLEPHQEEQLKALENIRAVSFVLEDRALFGFRDREYIATLKGVDDNFIKVTSIDSSLCHGSYDLFTKNPASTCVIGAGVAYYLGYNQLDMESTIHAFAPKSETPSLSKLNKAFTSKAFYPSAMFSIQPEFDEKYVITRLDLAQEFMGREGTYTAIEIALLNSKELSNMQESIKKLLGEGFEVLNRDEQQAVFFEIMNTEGLFTFLVFALILAIVTFTVMGSLTMLILDKKQNLRTLWVMGSNLSQLRRIFLLEGLLIGGTGALVGLVLGIVITYLQDQFQFITLGAGYMVGAYPVKLTMRDVVLVFLTVFILNSIISYFTSKQLSTDMLSKNF